MAYPGEIDQLQWHDRSGVNHTYDGILAAQLAIHGHIDGGQDVARFIFFVTMRQRAVYAVADSGATETLAMGWRMAGLALCLPMSLTFAMPIFVRSCTI